MRRSGRPHLPQHLCRPALQLALGLALLALQPSHAAAQPNAAPANDSAPKTISAITTRSPYCYQPDRQRDECFLGFELHFVSSSVSLTRLQVSISGRRVLEDRGFFQSSALIGHAQTANPGFKVACGLSGSGADPDPLIGQRYTFQIRAEDSDGLITQNFGVFSCPAFIPNTMFSNGFENP